MPNNIKEKITQDLQQVKSTGQVRSDRIRDIVKSAVSQVTSEVKQGSGELRDIVRDAISAVVENFQEKGGELKDEVAASLEGAIEGVSELRRRSISQTQSEMKQLETRLDTEEAELQQEIDRLLVDVGEADHVNTSPKVKTAITSAVESLRDSEEVSLMKKRYAQLQAQLAILRANLAARYGGRTEDIQGHLDEAKNWYNRSRPQAEAIAGQVEEKRSQLEERLGDAGTAVAKKERQIRQILSELLHSAGDALREKERSNKR
jgi:hypothetical protein